MNEKKEKSLFDAKCKRIGYYIMQSMSQKIE